MTYQLVVQDSAAADMTKGVEQAVVLPAAIPISCRGLDGHLKRHDAAIHWWYWIDPALWMFNDHRAQFAGTHAIALDHREVQDVAVTCRLDVPASRDNLLLHGIATLADNFCVIPKDPWRNECHA